MHGIKLDFLSFFEDCSSRVVLVYLVKNKNEAFAAFQFIHALVTTLPGKIKFLCTDNWGWVHKYWIWKYKEGCNNSVQPSPTNLCLKYGICGEVWCGTPGSYGHLCIFVHDAFMCISHDLRNKLHAKSIMSIFLGHGEEGEMSYKILRLQFKEVFREAKPVKR